jgi:hypothetical protein
VFNAEGTSTAQAVGEAPVPGTLLLGSIEVYAALSDITLDVYPAFDDAEQVSINRWVA